MSDNTSTTEPTTTAKPRLTPLEKARIALADAEAKEAARQQGQIKVATTEVTKAREAVDKAMARLATAKQKLRELQVQAGITPESDEPATTEAPADESTETGSVEAIETATPGETTVKSRR